MSIIYDFVLYVSVYDENTDESGSEIMNKHNEFFSDESHPMNSIITMYFINNFLSFIYKTFLSNHFVLG